VVVQGLADELSREGACDMAIYPDENIVITSCAIEGFYEEGVIKGSSLSLSLYLVSCRLWICLFICPCQQYISRSLVHGRATFASLTSRPDAWTQTHTTTTLWQSWTMVPAHWNPIPRNERASFVQRKFVRLNDTSVTLFVKS
jgi:hypothetical protein